MRDANPDLDEGQRSTDVAGPSATVSQGLNSTVCNIIIETVQSHAANLIGWLVSSVLYIISLQSNAANLIGL